MASPYILGVLGDHDSIDEFHEEPVPCSPPNQWASYGRQACRGKLVTLFQKPRLAALDFHRAMPAHQSQGQKLRKSCVWCGLTMRHRPSVSLHTSHVQGPVITLPEIHTGDVSPFSIFWNKNGISYTSFYNFFTDYIHVI